MNERADREDQKPIGRLYYEAQTGGGYSPRPRFVIGMDSVIPLCHKVIPLYTHPAHGTVMNPCDEGCKVGHVHTGPCWVQI